MHRFRRLICTALLIAVLPGIGLIPSRPAYADPVPQEGVHIPIFGLPFADPPGPSTWFVTQYYGNTTGAYRNRARWYEAGQGLHFGVDFSARCGTEVISIGDGEVVGIDDARRGSGPHNLLIRHANNTVSLYGHLLEAPILYIGQPIRQGQVVGLTGDPDLSCTSRPHLHLEIRSRNYNLAYNPIALIDADWDSLALFGPRGSFQRDLNNPRRWQTMKDQPVVDFWGPMLNEYERPWPPEW